MNIWLTLLLAGLLTYGIRLSFILVFAHSDMPALARRGLRFVPPAVLSAIILPELVLHAGTLNLTLSNARLLAGVVAGLVAWRTKNVFLTILAGMAALFVLLAVLPALL